MERVIRKNVVVVHPEHGRTTVKGVSCNLDALIEAARRWGARWTVLAAEVRFEREEAPNSRAGELSEIQKEGTDDG